MDYSMQLKGLVKKSGEKSERGGFEPNYLLNGIIVFLN